MRRDKIAYTKPAFTLVEVAVAIGIAGMVTAILLPAIARARMESYRVACMGNLRQIGLAIQDYAAASGGYFPPAFRSFRAPVDEQVLGAVDPEKVNYYAIFANGGGWYDRLIEGKHLQFNKERYLQHTGSPLWCPLDNSNDLTPIDTGGWFYPNAISRSSYKAFVTTYGEATYTWPGEWPSTLPRPKNLKQPVKISEIPKSSAQWPSSGYPEDSSLPVPMVVEMVGYDRPDSDMDGFRTTGFMGFWDNGLAEPKYSTQHLFSNRNQDANRSILFSDYHVDFAHMQYVVINGQERMYYPNSTFGEYPPVDPNNP